MMATGDRETDKTEARRAVDRAVQIYGGHGVKIDPHATGRPCEGGHWVAADLWVPDEPAWIHDPSWAEQEATAELKAAVDNWAGCGDTHERGGRTHTCTLHTAGSHVDGSTSVAWPIKKEGE